MSFSPEPNLPDDFDIDLKSKTAKPKWSNDASVPVVFQDKISLNEQATLEQGEVVTTSTLHIHKKTDEQSISVERATKADQVRFAAEYDLYQRKKRGEIGRRFPAMLRITQFQATQMALFELTDAERLIAADPSIVAQIPEGEKLQALCRILTQHEKAQEDELQAYKDRCAELTAELEKLKSASKPVRRSRAKAKAKAGGTTDA